MSEAMDDGWIGPIPMPVVELAIVEEVVDFLAGEDVQISTAYEISARGIGNAKYSYSSGVDCADIANVQFYPETPEAVQRLYQILRAMAANSRN